MNRIEKAFNKLPPIVYALILGTGIMVAELDFTFGEVCIVSIVFYCYLNLKEMIHKLTNKEVNE